MTEGVVAYSDPHAKDRLVKHGMTTVDCMNVLRGGVVDPGEWEGGAWRYRIRTNRFVVVVEFESESEVLIVTAWRLKP